MVSRRRDPDFSHEWNGVFVMTPHDLWLEPDDEPESETCDACKGWGWIEFDGEHNGCAECEGTGYIVLTDAERRQKAFDDFDPPDNYSED